MNRLQRRALAAALALALAASTSAAPVPNGFRVYGFVTRNGAPFSGTVDLQIQLFDAAGGNGTIGPTVTLEDVSVVGGDLVTFVDFGAQNPFVDMDTYLGGGIRLGSSTGTFGSFTTRARFSPNGFTLHAQKVAPATVGSNEIRSAEVQRRIATGCPDGEAIKSVGVDGGVVCAPLGSGGGGGDISGVAAGIGLAGGGDSGMVTLSVASLGITGALIADNAVDAAKIATAAVSADEIATDAVGSAEIAANAVTGAEIAANTITQADADTTTASGLQRRVAGNCPAGQAIGSIAADGTVLCNTASAGWTLAGNAGTNPATNFVGTTDNQFFDIRTNNRRAMRFRSLDDPTSGVYGGPIASTAVIGGSSLNDALAAGATVGGGGNAEIANVAQGKYATVPGGIGNAAGGDYSFAAGRRATVRTGSQVGGGDTDGDQGSFVFADSQDAAFVTTGPNQFLIRASGGVGIGTAVPQSTLHVFQGASSTPFVGTLGGTRVLIEDDASALLTLAVPGAAQAGVGFQAGNSATAGQILYNRSVNPNGFDVIVNGITSPPALRVTNANRLEIGGSILTVPASVQTTGTTLSLLDSVNVSGNLTVSGTITASNCCAAPSDGTLKQAIVPLSSALQRVLALRGVDYEFTQDARTRFGLPEGPQIGFIAQELERLFPQWVRDDERGFKTVFLRPFDAVLAEAIEELASRDEARITFLQRDVAELTRENALLREQLDVRLTRLEQDARPAATQTALAK